MSDTAEWQHILGDRYSNNSRIFSIIVNTSTKAAYFSCGSTNQLNVNNAFSLGVQSTYKKSGNTIYINGTAKGTITEQIFTTPNNIVLFGARNNGTLVYPFFGRIANCKFLRDGNTIRDFIPVRKNGVGYMYDKVSKQLFGNDGTGSFTYGNDKNS